MNLIHELRKKVGMPRRVFAETLGVTYQAIAQYEKGVRVPSISVCYRLIDLAKKYKIKVQLEDIYPRSD